MSLGAGLVVFGIVLAAIIAVHRVSLSFKKEITRLKQLRKDAQQFAIQIQHLAFKHGETINLEKASFRLETCRDLARAFLNKHFREGKE